MTFRCRHCIFAILLLSPLGTNLNSLHPRMISPKFDWNWSSGSEDEDFQISSMYFCYFVIISHWKWAWPFIRMNLNPFHPRMICAKFDWNYPSGSAEENFHISSMYFRHFVIISPWKWAWPFIWTNLIPLPKVALSQVWLKLAKWFWRRRWKCEKFTTTTTTTDKFWS